MTKLLIFKKSIRKNEINKKKKYKKTIIYKIKNN